MSWPCETGVGWGGAGGERAGRCSVTLDAEITVEWMSSEDTADKDER